jgi:hypothetical protein
MQDDHIDPIDLQSVVHPDVRPSRPSSQCGRSQHLQRFERWYGNAFPHVPRPELTYDRCRAANVIRIAVRQHHEVEPPYPGSAQDGSDDAIPDVEGGRAGDPAGVHEHRRALREAYECRIALPDISERHTQATVTVADEERPRLGHDPHACQHRNACSCQTVPPPASGRPSQVVDDDGQPVWRRDAEGQQRRKLNEIGAANEAGSREVRDVSDRRCQVCGDDPRRTDRHPRDLG